MMDRAGRLPPCIARSKDLLGFVVDLRGDQPGNDKRHDTVRMKMRRRARTLWISHLDRESLPRRLARQVFPDPHAPARLGAGSLRVGTSPGGRRGHRHEREDCGLIESFYTDDMAVLSPAQLPAELLRSAVRVAMSGADVRDRIGVSGRGAKLLVYVLPETSWIADLPLDPQSSVATHRGHHVPLDFDPARYRVLFTRVRSHDRDASGAAIIKKAYGRDPIVVVGVNTQTGAITGIETPPPHVLWGDIPTPLF